MVGCVLEAVSAHLRRTPGSAVRWSNAIGCSSGSPLPVANGERAYSTGPVTAATSPTAMTASTMRVAVFAHGGNTAAMFVVPTRRVACDVPPNVGDDSGQSPMRSRADVPPCPSRVCANVERERAHAGVVYLSRGKTPPTHPPGTPWCVLPGATTTTDAVLSASCSACRPAWSPSSHRLPAWARPAWLPSSLRTSDTCR